MADKDNEKWLKWMPATTVLFAVCATLSTFKGGGYSNKSLMNQTSASDQWSFYQSKSLKSYVFEMQKDNLELQSELLKNSNPSKEVLAKYEEKITSCAKKIHQYELDKEQISITAKKFEAERDECKLHGSAFGIAVIFLQISILLSSISALAKKKYVWVLGLIVGFAGIIFFLDGFFLFL